MRDRTRPGQPGGRVRRRASVAGRRAADLEWLLATLLSHYGPQHWWPARTRLEVMAGAILTQRTQWPVAAAAVGTINTHGSSPSMPSGPRAGTGLVDQFAGFAFGDGIDG